MAEIYASQGHLSEAVNVYRNLLARNPQETHYQQRIEELEMLASAAAAPGRASESAAAAPTPTGGGGGERLETIRVLEDWLDAIRKSRRA